MYNVMRFGLEFSQNHNHTAPHFCNHVCDSMYKIRFERLEVSIFFKFWVFPTQSKIKFSLCFGPSFKLLSFFRGSFFSQHLLGLSNFFFFLKTKVIKLLIIYLILKINKYINIERESMVWCGL